MLDQGGSLSILGLLSLNFFKLILRIVAFAVYSAVQIFLEVITIFGILIAFLIVQNVSINLVLVVG